jgi:radical SAM protein with 4Fe4S-binding SPASM domain
MTDKLENYYSDYDYGKRTPLKISMDELTEKEEELLIKSDTFCILPWIHLHAYPDGRAYPCCLAKYENHVGSLKENTMEEIWRDKPMQELRNNMLNEIKSEVCTKCYEQEDNGFFSMRNSSNKNFGHHIKTLDSDEFKIRYYDIRFSNLCNLACRSCGDVFSSNWVKEAKKMQWLNPNHPNVSYAGRYKTDAWEQLLPHIPYLEEVYFAGGEPLMMQEHYDLLKELLRQGRNDVKLVYNTNFTELVFKGDSVLPLWNEFECVSIGASLDASYERAELMRHGTVWSKVVKNREEMLKICPTVDFYVSSTLSIMNSYHLPDFHKEWIELELVRPMDWNINILQSPEYYRIDVLPEVMKEEVVQKYNDHIEYLKPLDEFSRASKGYMAAVNYITNTDNTKHISELKNKLSFLDRYRNQNFYSVFPELERLNEYGA